MFYEADAWFSFVNPFLPLDVENPSYAQKLQKPLKVCNHLIILIVFIIFYLINVALLLK